MMLLNACSKMDETMNPTDINVNGKIISFYSNKEKVEELLGEGKNVGDGPGAYTTYDDGKLGIHYNEEGKIRAFVLSNSSVKTYNNITCNDDISKVNDTYEYEVNIGNSVQVLLDGNKEVKWKGMDERADDQIIIQYYTRENNTIYEITMTDMRYIVYRE